jgi:hypothetical protein
MRERRNDSKAEQDCEGDGDAKASPGDSGLDGTCGRKERTHTPEERSPRVFDTSPPLA